MKKNNIQNNRIYSWLPLTLEIVLLLMTVVIVVRFASFTAVTKLGVTNSVIVSWSKGVDLSATASSEGAVSEDSQLDSLKKSVVRYTGIVESFCTVSFPISRSANKVVSWINKNILNNDLSNNPGIYGVSKPAGKAAEDIIEFMNYLETNNIPHVYVHTPYIEYYRYCNGKQNMIERWDTVNGRDRFLNKLNDSGMDYIDVYRDKGEYNLTYDTSNHWISENALFATKLTADYLNKKYGFSIDTKKLEKNVYYDIASTNEDFQKKVSEFEGFEWQYLVPMDEGIFSVTRDSETITGDFVTCFVNPYDEWKTSEDVYHNVCGLNNGNPYYITNNSVTDGSKCLIIGDSFDWPVYSYMAELFNYETAVWNFTNDFSYYDYIDSWKPDVVIVMLNDCQLSGDYHFDFNK